MKQNDSYNGGEKLVKVHVPEKLLGTVYRIMADGMQPSNEKPLSAIANSVPATNEQSKKEWTQQEINELKEISLSPTVEVLLDLTSKRAGNWVEYAEIREKAGKEPREAQGELSGFSQLLRRKFDRQGQEEWPVQVKAMPQGQTRYNMPHSIAQWWKSDWIEDSETLENELDLLIERCTNLNIEDKEAAQVVNNLLDALLEFLPKDFDTERRVLGEVMHHANKIIWEAEKDSSCLPAPMQLMFNSSFFKEEYSGDDEDKDEDEDEDE